MNNLKYAEPAVCGQSSEIENQQTILDHRITELQNALDTLGSRLTPVLRVSGLANSNEGKAVPRETLSPVASRTRDQSDYLSGMIMRVHELIDGLAV